MEAKIELDLIECSQCGIPFGVTSDRVKRLRECHNTFYCPMGHGQSFPQKTEAERLREKVSVKEKEIELLKANQKKRTTKKAKVVE